MGLAKQGVFTGTQQKREVMSLLKKGPGNQKVFKNVIRSCRNKIREVKTQL